MRVIRGYNRSGRLNVIIQKNYTDEKVKEKRNIHASDDDFFFGLHDRAQLINQRLKGHVLITPYNLKIVVSIFIFTFYTINQVWIFSFNT